MRGCWVCLPLLRLLVIGRHFLLLGVIAVLFLAAGLLTLEVCLAFPVYRNHFDSMAKRCLGSVGRVVTWIIFLLLLYSAVAAYIAGSASLLSSLVMALWHIVLPSWLMASMAVLLFGGIIFWSTRSVDYAVRLFMSAKGLFLIVMLSLLWPHINMAHLTQANHGLTPLWWAGIPILLVSMTYHIIIPSLTSYLNKDVQKMWWISVCSITIPLVIYGIWITSVLGIVPLLGHHSFLRIAQHHTSVGGLTAAVNYWASNYWVRLSVHGFSNIAMTTSFLGAGLSLFDFLAESFKRPNTRSGRFQTALLTFALPLLFAICYPQGFLYALNYTGFAIAVLVLVLPPLMAYRLRHHLNLPSAYRLPGGDVVLLLILICGIVISVLSLLTSLHVFSLAPLLK